MFRFKLKIKFSAQKMMISANRFSALKKLFFESLISIVECGLKKGFNLGNNKIELSELRRASFQSEKSNSAGGIFFRRGKSWTMFSKLAF